MTKNMVWTILALFLIVASSAAVGQTGYRPKFEFGEARFAIDAADFRSDQENLHTLEIYYKIFYDALSFQKTAGGYEARYELAIVVEGENGVQIEGIIKERTITVKTYAEARRATDFIINLLRVDYDKQDVTVRATLIDKLGESSRTIEKRLKNRDYWGKYPTISRAEFAREVFEATTESKFNKGEDKIIPSVSHIFGGPADSIMEFYVEVYPGTSNEKYLKLLTRLIHMNKGTVYTDSIRYGEITETQTELIRVNTMDLPPGDYQLEMRLEGRRGRLYSKLEENLELELTAESISRNDFETAIKMLKYLATKDEMNAMKKAETPEEQQRLWDEFWLLRDTNPNDRLNPTRQEYFRRIRHSNRYFSVMNKEGWTTGRGMVYIMYGEPDEVDDHPFELASKPYQYWIYYRINPPRKFLFVDEWSDGDYELQPPYDGLQY